MMVTYMNFPGFYFFIAHRYTLQFFRNIFIIINNFFSPVIHFMPVIMSFQLVSGLNDLNIVIGKFSVDS
jgi:hypothetical protein